MKQLCNNPNNNRYEDWGGRGITYCSEWESFDNFKADMGEPPSSRHSINRLDNDEDYSKGNCEWATPEVQAINTRTRKDNLLGEKNISLFGGCYRVTFYRNKKRYSSLSVKTLEEAIELRNLALESL